VKLPKPRLPGCGIQPHRPLGRRRIPDRLSGQVGSCHGSRTGKAAQPHFRIETGRRCGPAPLRFSAGIAGCRGTSLSARELIDRADKALYRAKNEGRGRTCIYKEPDLHGAFAVPTMATATVAEPA
jgi:hypothetical protein